MAEVKIKNLNKFYGKVRVLHDINLNIKQGEFIVMVGPSGCGKSTLLRMIAGLVDITSGTLEIGGEVVNDLPSSLRGIAMVFQNYALYPHMTVYDNMAFSLRMAKLDKSEIDESVHEAAEFLQLTPYLNRIPKSLSGGQRQRVAIGRAIVRKPKVFLFDEPLSNLDAKLRVATRIKIAKLKESMPESTMIYVTHDQVEAMTLADRIVVLSSHGTIEQVGSPIELYTRPANLFVAGFIGSPAMNIIPGVITQTGTQTHLKISNLPEFPISIPTDPAQQGASVQLGIRPEDLTLATDDNQLIEGKLAYTECLGEVTQLYLDVFSSEEYVVVKLQGIVEYPIGQSVPLTAEMDKIHLFDEAGLTLRKSP